MDFETQIPAPSRIKYAGFWIRLLADFLDSLFLDVAAIIFALMYLGVIYWSKVIIFSQNSVTSSTLDFFDSFTLQIILVLSRLGLSVIYYTWITYRSGTTFGKKVFRIYVVSIENFAPINLKQSLYRSLSYGISYLPLLGGFLIVPFQSQKRALHDFIAGTVTLVKTE